MYVPPFVTGSKNLFEIEVLTFNISIKEIQSRENIEAIITQLNHLTQRKCIQTIH